MSGYGYGVWLVPECSPVSRAPLPYRHYVQYKSLTGFWRSSTDLLYGYIYGGNVRWCNNNTHTTLCTVADTAVLTNRNPCFKTFANALGAILLPNHFNLSVHTRHSSLQLKHIEDTRAVKVVAARILGKNPKLWRALPFEANMKNLGFIISQHATPTAIEDHRYHPATLILRQVQQHERRRDHEPFRRQQPNLIVS